MLSNYAMMGVLFTATCLLALFSDAVCHTPTYRTAIIEYIKVSRSFNSYANVSNIFIPYVPRSFSRFVDNVLVHERFAVSLETRLSDLAYRIMSVRTIVNPEH